MFKLFHVISKRFVALKKKLYLVFNFRITTILTYQLGVHFLNQIPYFYGIHNNIKRQNKRILHCFQNASKKSRNLYFLVILTYYLRFKI